MKIKSQKLLDARDVVIGSEYFKSVASHSLTVYVGIHNAAAFLEQLLRNLLGQTLKNYPLILVDNCSSDDSWSKIQKWPNEITDRAKLIRNPLNLGGTGSLALNSREVETDWFVTLHQDDTYKSNHLAALSRAISGARQEDLLFFSDMGTQSMGGKKLSTPIRQSWIANLDSKQSAFVANLVQQSVSYPSSAFRTSGMSEIQIPWHSSSFPDTEISLLQASQGYFKYIPEETMLYRMNPKSESHDLNPKERVLGPFASLSRVMASDSFMSLCSEIEEKDRTSFSKSVLKGIDLRLGESPFSEIVKLIAAETMALAWDYTETNSREQILETYKLAEEGRTTKLLEDLGAFYGATDSSTSNKQSAELTNAQLDLEQLLAEAAPPSTIQSTAVQKALLMIIGGLFPIRVRRKVIAFLVKSFAKLDPKSPWNLSWTPKN